MVILEKGLHHLTSATALPDNWSMDYVFDVIISFIGGILSGIVSVYYIQPWHDKRRSKKVKPEPTVNPPFQAERQQRKSKLLSVDKRACRRMHATSGVASIFARQIFGLRWIAWMIFLGVQSIETVDTFLSISLFAIPGFSLILASAEPIKRNDTIPWKWSSATVGILQGAAFVGYLVRSLYTEQGFSSDFFWLFIFVFTMNTLLAALVFFFRLHRLSR